MSRKCKLTNKKSLSGNNVSHSNRKTRTKQKANLKKIKLSLENKTVKVKISTSILRTIHKKGLKSVLKKLKINKI